MYCIVAEDIMYHIKLLYPKSPSIFQLFDSFDQFSSNSLKISDA